MNGWVLALAIACGGTAVAAAPGEPDWRRLADGLEYTSLRFIEQPDFGGGRLHVVRVDPGKVEVRAVLSSKEGLPNRTASEWAEGVGLAVAMNAGMFETDYLRNVGYLRDGEHLNNGTWHSRYQSVLAFGPVGKSGPSLQMVDLDTPGTRQVLQGYRTVVQNLRLLKAEGANVWKPSKRRWSEAALGVDGRGRLLFLFSRSPLSMHEFNQRLGALPLDIRRAMHAEGGPEASLSIRAEGFSLDLSGSYETGFNENDDNRQQWPLPNVIGVSLPGTGR